MGDIELLTVVCGKKYCLDRWLSYIEQLSYKPSLSRWVIVNNAGDKFASLLKSEIKKKNFSSNFDYIIVNGPGKFQPPPGLDWRDPEVNLGKHRSTGASFSIGFKLCSAKFVYTIDDDVMPPESAFGSMYNKIKHNDNIGAIGGLYFNNSGWETGNPWRTKSQLKRTVVASIKKEHWYPAMIDDCWDRGYIEGGFLGTGCTMYNLEDVKKCLPMRTILRGNGLILGPDGELCQQIRTKCNKEIFIDSNILCEHWETETKEAGIGRDNFLKSTIAFEDGIIAGGFGDLQKRMNAFKLARKFAKKNKLKLILVWPRNEETGWKWNVPWNTDSSIHEIIYFHESDELKNYENITGEKRKLSKIQDEIYFNQLNSGKYRKLYNFLNTTEAVSSHSYLTKLQEEKQNAKT